MRAARTPPEPPPITKRSVSNSAMGFAGRGLKIVALLFHLGAEAVHHFLANARRPLLHESKSLIEDHRLSFQHFLAERCLVEREHVLQLSFGESDCIESARLSNQLDAARGKFISQLRADVVEVLGELRVHLQQAAL